MIDLTTAANEPNATDKVSKIATAMIRWGVAAYVWIIQYGFAVWVVYGWRFIKWLVRCFGAAAVLVFLPVVGWIILLLLFEVAEERGRSLGSGRAEHKINHRALLRPWLLDWAKGNVGLATATSAALRSIAGTNSSTS
jgi:hypothetical protein